MAYDQRSLDDYVDVATRIADFRKQYPEGSLSPRYPGDPYRIVQAEGWEKDGTMITQTFVVVVAAAYRTPDDPTPGVGMAWEIFPGRTPYTRGSELQNAETSAWGRAIIAVGASDSKKGIASREEVAARRAERDNTQVCQCGHGKHVHTDATAPPGCSQCDCGLTWNRDGSLSRSRTTDEQKAAAGVMTDAEQKAHNQLAKPPPNEGGVMRVTSDEAARIAQGMADPWQDGPAGLTPQDDPEDRPGTATPEQLRAMHAAFTQLGVKDRDKRLELTRSTLNLDMLHSSARLSYRQAADLLLALNGLKVAK